MEIPPTFNRQEFERSVKEKALRDPEFRQALSRDARGVLEREAGFDFPADVRIQLHEEDAQTIHFVLPPATVEDEERDLSDEQLQQAAGGGQYSGITKCGECWVTFGTL